jgi:hypothetical protein
MDDRRELWITLAWRVGFAAALALVGGLLLAGRIGPGDVAGRRLLGLACVVAAGIVVAPGFAGFIAEPVGSLFYPRRISPPEPCRSIADARRKRGDHTEALAAYEDVVAEFPGDLPSWTAMVEIAVVDLQDRPRGDALARRALSALADEPARFALVRVHRNAGARLRAAQLASL